MVVSEQIIQVLDYIGEKFGIAIDWTSDNVIPYITTLCQKLVSYEIWTSVAWIAIMSVLSIIAVVCAIALRRQLKDSVTHGEGFMMIPYAAFAGICIATIIVVGFQIFDIIKCVTFPELYVFEYIKTLVEGSK